VRNAALTTQLLRQKTRDSRIDSLARDIEQQIAENEQTLQEYEFPEGKQIRNSGVSTIEEIMET